MSKVCKTCRTRFDPEPLGAIVCSQECAGSFAVSKRGKAEKVASIKERKADRVKLDGMITRGQWITKAQASFNAYIRARDAGKPCICCGRMKDSNAIGGTWDAGHFRSRGSAPHLRFDERNVHAQLKFCNRYQAGNMAGYRLGLIERIGLEALEALESDQTLRKYTLEELKAIRADYQARTKELKAQA